MFCSMPLYWGFVWCFFLIIRLELLFFESKATYARYHFYDIIWRVHTISYRLITMDIDLNYLPEVVFVKFLHCKVTHHLPFHIALLKSSQLVQSTFKYWGVMIHLQGEISIYIIWTISTWKISFFLCIYLWNNLFMSVWTQELFFVNYNLVQMYLLFYSNCSFDYQKPSHLTFKSLT